MFSLENTLCANPGYMNYNIDYNTLSRPNFSSSDSSSPKNKESKETEVN